MRNAEKIEKLLKKYFKAKQHPVTPDDKREEQTIDAAITAFNNSNNTARSNITPGLWRTIMQSKITKFAVAALIAFGVFLIMTIPDSSGVAWADVVKQIRSLRTMQCVSTVEVKGQGANDNLFDVDVQSNVYLKDPGLSRIEIMGTSTAVSDVVIRKQTENGNVRIVYKPNGPRTYHRQIINKKADGSEIDSAAVRMWGLIEKLTSDQTRKEHTEQIAGVDTVVFSASLEDVFPQCPYTGLTKVWVNSKTAVPLRVQSTFKDNAGVVRRLTLDNIQWDIPLPDDLFDAPDGWQAIEHETHKETIPLKGKQLRKDVKITFSSEDGRTIVTEADIKSLTAANLVVAPDRRDIRLTVVLKKDARQRVKTYTTEHVGEKILIEFDGRYKYEPMIMSSIDSPVMMIMLPSTDMTLTEFEEKYLH